MRRDLPDVRTSVATAEDIPAADHSVDVVVAAQCYHWFDHPRALDEVNRVLRPGGLFAVVWHERDERIPWVRKLGRIIGTQDQQRDPADTIDASSLFHEVEAEVFKNLGDWDSADVCIATGWQTAFAARDLPGSREKVYLVQDHEPEFFGTSVQRVFAEDSYRHDVYAITAGAWLAETMGELYGLPATSFDLGIDGDRYRPLPSVARRDDVVLAYARSSTPRGNRPRMLFISRSARSWLLRMRMKRATATPAITPAPTAAARSSSGTG